MESEKTGNTHTFFQCKKTVAMNLFAPCKGKKPLQTLTIQKQHLIKLPSTLFKTDNTNQHLLGISVNPISSIPNKIK